MVRATRYPNCCNAAVLYAFGDCTNANNEDGEFMKDEELRKEISRHEKTYVDEGYSVLTATINSEQERVGKILDSLDWESTPWIEKGKAGGTLLKFYWKVIGKGTVESVEEWNKQKEDRWQRRIRETAEEMERDVEYAKRARDEYDEHCGCLQCLGYKKYRETNAA